MDPRFQAPPPQGDESAWHALADGRLAPEAAARLRQQAQADALARDTIAHWQRQRTLLQSLHRGLLDEPVPDALLKAARRAADSHAQQAQWWRWGGMTAAVLVAFGLGWAGRSHWPDVAASPQQALARPAQRFAQQAAVAHAVYQPEVRHPVEVGAAQQEHLVQWLSKRLNRPLTVPALAAQGYELVGGRLLPGDTGARAQFMYQNSTGQRITLYLGVLSPERPKSAPALPREAAPAPTTAFAFSQDGPVPAFYRTDGGFGYALSGQLPRSELLALATAVYQQLQH
jgi:anti-sigma factor RsiW